MSRNYLFLFVFLLMAIQMLLSLLQVKQYKKALNGMRGSGILGIGHTKGNIKEGQILILSYDPRKDEVVSCKQMKGITIFATFKEVEVYKGQSLEAVRKIGIELDQKEFKRRRKKHPYDPKELTKKKGALIQAVEAIKTQIQREQLKANEKTIVKRNTQEMLV
ncbi:MAG: transcriptional regulator GutM [Eubacteriaceae bacterium]